MRIVFDLDGVICELKKPSESYSEVSPKKKSNTKNEKSKGSGTLFDYSYRKTYENL